MKNFVVTFLLAVLIVLASASLRQVFAIGGTPPPRPMVVGIGGTPPPRPMVVGIGGTPPPRPMVQAR
ncbi:MAG: hypothetical protein LAO07_11740 [Acidobacteriia bacterium]|nr:hypothetical protein [Terriglobia bacterium]